MSRFNAAAGAASKTVNFAGGEAYAKNPELELVSLLLTSFVKDQYYRKADESVKRVGELIALIPDKEFAAKAAIYARTEFGMRSVSHVVAAEVARNVKGAEWTKRFFDKVVYRPDDMTEILSLYRSYGLKNEPNSLKKGFAKALARFDEYQIAKYRGEGKEISLVDIVNLVHPQNTPAIAALIKGTLAAPETWETKLNRTRDAETDEAKEEMKKQAWGELLRAKKLGYMALLKNLRNIIEQSPENVPLAIEQLLDKKAIAKSLVLPFRYMTALDEVRKLNGEGVRNVVIALSQALETSISNVPKFAGRTLVVLDTSGSMSGQPKIIGSMFAAALYKSNDADLMVFGSSARYLSPNPLDSAASIADIMLQDNGGGTNFHAIFQEANRPYDRAIILSDEQGWEGGVTPDRSFSEYANRVGKRPLIYSFDLQGYGTMQFPEKGVYCIAGFSEKVFDIMKLLEEDHNALVSKIKEVVL